MCIRDRIGVARFSDPSVRTQLEHHGIETIAADLLDRSSICLLYTSDAADERSSVDLGGRRIIKKKKERDRECAVAAERRRQKHSRHGQD